jgi:polar amino acid transport system substrate-binding protein
MTNPRLSRSPVLALALSLLLLASTALADEKIYRVGLIAQSPPLSFIDETGKFTGFNVEIAAELCTTLKIRCVQHSVALEKIIDLTAADQIDFAVVGFFATPERQARVLFTKTYFQSASVWLAKPSVPAGKAGSRVAVIKGSAQATHALSMGWNTVEVATPKEIAAILASGAADAAVLPMLNALALSQDTALHAAGLSVGLKSTVLKGSLATGTLHMVVNPKQPELLERINAAIDQIKRDGRFDRINRKFVPFSLL